MGKRSRARCRALTESAVPTVESLRSDVTPLLEAIPPSGTVELRVITPGWGTSGYYSPDVLEAAGADGVFAAGTQMFWDHPTAAETVDRPERSLRDLAAVLETAAVWQPHHPQGPGLYARAQVFAPFRDLLSEMAPHIGVSIRAAGEASIGEAEGRRGRIIERLTAAQSVDFVTRPGRGGAVLAILESHRPSAVEAGLWSDDLRQRLADAVTAQFAPDDEQWAYIRDWTDTEVVFELYGSGVEPGFYQAAWSLDGDTVQLDPGAPVRVQVRTIYTPVAEARSIGQWLESHLHLDFTRMADEMAAEGRLTRAERIGLSSAIGDALAAFVAAVPPQLYQRDLYEEPPDPVTTEETMTPEQIQEAVAAQVQTAVTAAVQEAIAPLTETITTLTTDNARLREADLIRAARDAVTDLVEADAATLLPATRARIVATVMAESLPTGDNGDIDTDALTARTRDAIAAESAYLAEAAGNPVRLGSAPTTDGTNDADQAIGQLAGVFGLTEAGKAAAVAGR